MISTATPRSQSRYPLRLTRETTREIVDGGSWTHAISVADQSGQRATVCSSPGSSRTGVGFFDPNSAANASQPTGSASSM